MRLEHKLSYTGWKYGYITWKKRDDERFEELFGGRTRRRFTASVAGHFLPDRRPDWRKRRLAITITLSRSLPEKATLLLRNDREGVGLYVTVVSNSSAASKGHREKNG